MVTPGPGDGSNPFEGMPIFGDLAKLFTSAGPVNAEVARQIGNWMATEGKPELNVDPLERIRLDELLRVAELHVADLTGLATSPSGSLLGVRAVGRAEYASATLDAYRPLLERLATSLGGAAAGPDATMSAAEQDPSTEFLGSLGALMAPMLLGMQAGFMVGHLAQRALSQYDLPIPRPTSDQLLVVPANLNVFAEEWSLPPDDVRLWVCLEAVAHHAVLSRPHVRAALLSLIEEHAEGFEVDPSALEGQIGEIDPADPSSWESAFGNPEALLGALQGEAQRRVLPRIEALVSAVEGYVDYVLDRAARQLVGSIGALTEARRRRRVERGEGDRIVERVFGVELAASTFDRGAAFIAGIVERAGEEGLSRLWHSERELPTPAEVDAPGLWLARIDLPD